MTDPDAIVMAAAIAAAAALGGTALGFVGSYLIDRARRRHEDVRRYSEPKRKAYARLMDTVTAYGRGWEESKATADLEELRATVVRVEGALAQLREATKGLSVIVPRSVDRELRYLLLVDGMVLKALGQQDVKALANAVEKHKRQRTRLLNALREDLGMERLAAPRAFDKPRTWVERALHRE